MAICNHSITADEYVINANLVSRLVNWEESDIERLFNHMSLEEKRKHLKEIESNGEHYSHERERYLDKLKAQLERELRNE